MPDITASRPTHDQDTGDRKRAAAKQEAAEREAGKQLACGFANYTSKVRAWLDLNLESRRGALDAPPALRKASGTGR